MSLSPAAAASQARSPALLKLQEFLSERRRAGKAAPDFEKFEEEWHALIAAVECEGLAEELERQDVDVPLLAIGGEPHRRVVRCEETYFAPSGPV